MWLLLMNILLLLRDVCIVDCLPAVNVLENRSDPAYFNSSRYVALANSAGENVNISEKLPFPVSSPIVSSTTTLPSSSSLSTAYVTPVISTITSSTAANISSLEPPLNPITVIYNTISDKAKLGDEAKVKIECLETTTLSELNVTKLNVSSSEDSPLPTTADSVFNVTVIVGISSLVILIIVLIGVTSFLLYRHFSWNRPQTLSDKFSNDESTGYIDDSAFRENSEEMYSLDNDSFLNSLEAMTIQNYWTDNVKHTKL